jgi:uroporphyrinogen-III synthase
MQYDPHQDPAPVEWLALDEAERIMAAEEFHVLTGAPLPNPRLHAVVHAIIETQLALGVEAVVGAIRRLRKEGLDRHDSIHAVGSVLANHMQSLLGVDEDPPEEGEYYAALDTLSAESWKREYS